MRILLILFFYLTTFYSSSAIAYSQSHFRLSKILRNNFLWKMLNVCFRHRQNNADSVREVGFPQLLLVHSYEHIVPFIYLFSFALRFYSISFENFPTLVSFFRTLTHWEDLCCLVLNVGFCFFPYTFFTSFNLSFR